MFRCERITHMIIGAPIKAVIAFRGKVAFDQGISAISADTSAINAPMRIVAGTRIRWSEVLKRLRHKWGTANAKNAIGPQKAVTVPAKIAVERIISRRAR